MHDRDKGGKWLIRHYGGTILRLAGIPGLISWKAIQAEPVQPRRLPDGLIEARLRGRSEPSLFTLEISTYPYPRIPLVPLSRFDGPVEPILDECRKRIERDVPEGLRENMRVVTHFMAGLK